MKNTEKICAIYGYCGRCKSQIAENELVQNNGEYARKKLCVHNNPYYAFIGTREDVERLGYTAEQIDAAAEVSDWDTVTVEACCG